MMRRGKFFVMLGGVVVLVAGVFIGAFLVLRSEAGRGQFFGIDNESVADFKTQTTRALLNELAALRTGETGTANKNLTQELLDTIDQEAAADNLTEDIILSYLETNSNAIFPSISDQELNIKSSAGSREYLNEVSVHLLLLAGAWQKIIELEDQDAYTQLSTLLSEGESALRVQAVPPRYLEFHKRVLQLYSAVRVTVDNALLPNGNDPLLGLIAIARL